MHSLFNCRLIKYLSLLKKFIDNSSKWVAHLKADRTGFLWSSPLSNHAADARFSVRNLLGEQIMVRLSLFKPESLTSTPHLLMRATRA